MQAGAHRSLSHQRLRVRTCQWWQHHASLRSRNRTAILE